MSHPPPPPYGAPQDGPRFPPQPPRPGPPQGSLAHEQAKRRRPSKWWFLVAAVVLVVSLAGGVGGLVYTAVNTFGTVGTVTADGTTHRIVADAERDAFLWANPQLPERCSIIDSATGEEIQRGSLNATYTKTTGGRSWQVINRFDPGSGRLDITCPTGSSDVQVGPATEFGVAFGSFALFIALTVGGSLVGIISLIVLTVLFATGRPRDESD